MSLKLFLRGFLLATAGVLWTSASLAYFIATEPSTLRAGVPTDVFVAGFGDDQGEQFLKTAILAAKVSRDRFPERQRVIISPVNESLDRERALLSREGFGFRKADKDALKKDRLLKALKSLKVPVTSLQFFGHANTYNGFRLQSSNDRIDHTDSEFLAMGSVLAPNAFAAFNSCNSGWLLAPTAAKAWKRPAFGSLTSSDFHELMSDGQWYDHNPGQYPEDLKRIGNTSMITRETISCTSYKCLRLRPVNSSYVSKFGNFEKGLGFYKVFSYDDKLIPQALIHFTLLSPSIVPLSRQSSRDQMLDAAADWMCPVDKSNQRRNACKEAIRAKAYEADPTLSFFRGKAIACNNKDCFTKVECSAMKAIIGAVPCKSVTIDEQKSTVFSDQMKQIVEGIDLFEKGQLDL